MDEQTIKAALIAVLEEIQNDSGYEVVEITGTTRPVDDLEGFDSKLWPYAIGKLGKELGIAIEKRKNIYYSKDGTTPLSVDESAEIIHKILIKKTKK